MRVWIVRVVLLVAAHFDLLESPFGQTLVCSTEVTPQHGMTQAQSCRERVYPFELVATPAVKVINDFDQPVIVVVTNRSISVARDLVVQLCDWRRDVVRVQVATCGLVDKANEVIVLKESNGPIQVNTRLLPAWSNDPVIVGVLVVVARDLLLIRPDGVSLGMRV
jgi:hypothetical protein